MKKSHKKAIALSALTLLMSGTLIAGATFAWFTSSVSSKIKLHSGDLHVELHKYDETAGEYDDISNSEDSVFTDGEGIWWEPGYTSYAAIRVVNTGNLALQYDVVIDCKLEGDELADAAKLAEVIDVYYLDNGKADALAGKDRAGWLDTFEYVGTLSELLAMDASVTGGHLKGKKAGATDDECTDYAIIVLHMKEEATNEYKNLYGEYDITLHATQYTFEEDDFGDDYDERA